MYDFLPVLIFRFFFPEFDKHLKKAGGHIGRNVVEITIKMKTIVRKTLMIKNPQFYVFKYFSLTERSLRGGVASVLDCDIEERSNSSRGITFTFGLGKA